MNLPGMHDLIFEWGIWSGLEGTWLLTAMRTFLFAVQHHLEGEVEQGAAEAMVRSARPLRPATRPPPSQRALKERRPMLEISVAHHLFQVG